MEQAINGAGGGAIESKASTDLTKMIGAASGKGKVKDNQSGKGEGDLNALVPFLQILSQQLSQINQTPDAAANTNGEKITLEQPTLLLQDYSTLKELQQALSDLVSSEDGAQVDSAKSGQPGFVLDALVKEMDLLQKNLVKVDEKAKDPLIAAALAQRGTEEKVSEEENKTTDEITATLKKESKVKSGNGENEQKIINDEIDLKNFTGMKSDAGPLQPGKMISPEAQLSASAAGKNTVTINEVKEKVKISNDILPSESGKKDYDDVRNNSRLSTQEIKESSIGKDNYQSSGEQFSNAAKTNAGSKAQVDAMQKILEEISGPIKAEQKGKIISGEKGNEEISLSSVNAAGSGSAGTEKVKDVSPDRIISQVTSEIKEVAANDGGRVKITLNPPSLGKVEMDVTVRNGKVEVVLVADNKDVQQSLNTHIDKLKGSLQNQGLTIDRCDVLMQDKREEYQQSFSQHAFYQQSRSGQDSNSRRENHKEEVKTNTIASGRPANVIKVSTDIADNISLFA